MIQSSRFRLIFLGLAIIGGFALLLARLWHLQFIENDTYRKKLPGTTEIYHRIPAARGRILDRNGVELARNRTTLQVGLNLEEIVQHYTGTPPNRRELPKYQWRPDKDLETDIVKIVNEVVIKPLTALGLASDMHQDPHKALEFEDHLRVHYRTNKGEIPFNYIKNVDWESFAKFAEHNDIPGVTISQRMLREYPFGALTGHLMGYVKLFDNSIPKEDKGKFKFYEGDDRGVAGLEQTLDRYLRGKHGTRTLLINEHGRLEREITEKYKAPQPGDDVYLTIDIRMQYIAEMALRDGNVGRGAAVVQDPSTGEIMAMAAVPNYDPNNFIPSVTPANYKVYTDDETVPLLNRAIQGFAPGSTFKVPVALAGFLARPGTVGSNYSCDGTVEYGGRQFPCWTQQKGLGGHGSVDLVAALRSSCNCYFYQYGNAAGIDNIAKVCHLLGLGQTTGIELEGEQGGLIPDKAYLKRIGGGTWGPARTANVSIGQAETLATPLQMCCAVSAIASGGKVYHPTLFHHRLQKTTKLATKFTPSLRTDLLKEGVTKKQIERVAIGMLRVVTDAQGTGRRFKSDIPEIAEHGGSCGKTGTAQFKRRGVKDNHTWFICFAPYDRPKYAAAVLVQGGNSGGSCAAPVSKRIMEQCMSLETNTYRVDVNSIGRMKEAKGHMRFIESVQYDNENVPDLPENDADLGTSEDLSRESEPIVRGRAVPFEEPTLRTEGSITAPRNGTGGQPKYKPNKPNE